MLQGEVGISAKEQIDGGREEWGVGPVRLSTCAAIPVTATSDASPTTYPLVCFRSQVLSGTHRKNKQGWILTVEAYFHSRKEECPSIPNEPFV